MEIPCCNPCVTCEPSVLGFASDDPNGPILNVSSAAPDSDLFIERHYIPPGQPPLGSVWTAPGCVTTCVSAESQEEAAACAQRQNVLCVATNWPTVITLAQYCAQFPNAAICQPGFPDPPPYIPTGRQVFTNTAQTCAFLCSDGTPFNYTVAAGRFNGLSQESADMLAYLNACTLAAENRVCIGSLDVDAFCLGEDSVAESIISTALPYETFEMTAGELPPGMALSQTPTGFILEGTPTLTGNYTFSIKVTDSDGNTMTKVFTVYVETITNTSPMPQATLGDAYVLQMTADNTSGTVTWAVTFGSLPDGLTLDADSGIISGTPTVAGSFSFGITFTDER